MIRGIRGAITVYENSAAEILSATEKLLKEIIHANGLKIEDISSVIFTMTPDLNAVFPAEAARKMGWKNVPLLCHTEIAVPGSLAKCIRILLQAETQKAQDQVKHIYLEGAKILREDIAK